MDVKQFVKRQIAFSEGAFGHGYRTRGIISHILCECVEVLSEPSAEEWADLVLLSLDGLQRRCKYTNPDAHATKVEDILLNVLCRNEKRKWPKPESEDHPVFHKRT